MLIKDYNFVGKHAQLVMELTNEIDNNTKARIFETNIEVFLAAAVVGFYYKKRSKTDSSGIAAKRTIQMQQTSHRHDLIRFIYRLILLLDNEYESDPNERIKKAFTNIDGKEAKPDEEVFYEYILGGIEILHEKLINRSTNYFDNIGEFIEEIDIPDTSITDKLGISID
jgi:hypothetical protein